MPPNVLERMMDDDEIEVISELELAFEESAMAHGFTVEYVRSICARMLSVEELQYGLGVLT